MTIVSEGYPDVDAGALAGPSTPVSSTAGMNASAAEFAAAILIFTFTSTSTGAGSERAR
jgi:hypothetical protein